jgi:hypothetical protein
VSRVIFVSAAIARYSAVVVDESLDRNNELFWKMAVKQVAVRKCLLHVYCKDLVNLETVGYDD